PAHMDVHDLPQRSRSPRRHTLQGRGQTVSARNGKTCVLEQPPSRRYAQRRDAPPRNEGAQGPQVCDHQMVPRKALGMVRNGACHCGAVKFTAEIAEPLRGARCDCSICSVKGAVTVGTPIEGLEILA